MIMETHALLLNRVSQRSATRFLEQVYQSNMRIVRVQADDENRARAIIVRYSDKAFSYADASSFAVMDRLDIQLAFSFDLHVAQYGIVLVNRIETLP